jgi:hypothetical protein
MISAAAAGATSTIRKTAITSATPTPFLLTRARQGMVIFLPPGDPCDATRSPDYYDSTIDYLSDVGIPVISG